MTEIGDRLRAARHAAGFRSARELAEVSGVSREVIAQIESGRAQQISSSQLVAFCHACRCAAADLLPELNDDTYLHNLRSQVRMQIIQELLGSEVSGRERGQSEHLFKNASSAELHIPALNMHLQPGQIIEFEDSDTKPIKLDSTPADLETNKKQQQGDQLMTLSDVAQRINCPEQTLRYWVKIGTAPPSFKMGRRRMFYVDDVKSWLRQQKESN